MRSHDLKFNQLPGNSSWCEPLSTLVNLRDLSDLTLLNSYLIVQAVPRRSSADGSDGEETVLVVQPEEKRLGLDYCD